MSQKDQAEREKRKQDEEFDKMQARIRDMEQQLIAQKTSAKNLGATQSATDQAQDKLVQEQAVELKKLRDEIKIMNKKLDVSGVEKKVDTNVDEARAYARQKKEAEEEKARLEAEKAEKKRVQSLEKKAKEDEGKLKE